MTDNITDRAVDSIAKQFRGGEHKMAGARASELVYGNSKTPNQKLVDEIVAKAPGIERYISAPETPVTKVTDQAGDPLSRQPENDQNQISRSNVSTAEAIDEQNAIDARLSAGRARTDKSDVGETKLNPAGSDKDARAKPVKAKK